MSVARFPVEEISAHAVRLLLAANPRKPIARLRPPGTRIGGAALPHGVPGRISPFRPDIPPPDTKDPQNDEVLRVFLRN